MYAIYVNFGNILCLEFSIQGNLKYKTPRIYSVRRAAWLMTHSRLKLTWIDSRFNPVWKLIPFERALNCTQYMWIWQHFYVHHRRKLRFYIANCLIWRNSWWIWYVHVGVQFDCLFESTTECGAYFTVVHSHGVPYFTIRAKTQVARVNA